MRCTNCGNEVEAGAVYCPYCRTKMEQSSGQQSYQQNPYNDRTHQNSSYDSSWQSEPAAQAAKGYASESPYRGSRPMRAEDLPAEFRPMSAWGYFGWGILFAIPIVGFILLIVFSFAGGNVNRKHFARSYWCWLLIAVIVVLILMLTGVITTGSLDAWLRGIRF